MRIKYRTGVMPGPVAVWRDLFWRLVEVCEEGEIDSPRATRLRS